MKYRIFYFFAENTASGLQVHFAIAKHYITCPADYVADWRPTSVSRGNWLYRNTSSDLWLCFRNSLEGLCIFEGSVGVKWRTKRCRAILPWWRVTWRKDKQASSWRTNLIVRTPVKQNLLFGFVMENQCCYSQPFPQLGATALVLLRRLLMKLWRNFQKYYRSGFL